MTIIEEKVTIRPVTSKDLPRVFQIARAKELKAANHHFAERWWIRDFLKAKQPFFVATNQKQIIGFVLGECATGKVAICHLMAVDEQYHRQGVGTALMHAFERECRHRKMKCILLYFGGGKPVESALKKHGYARGSLVREFQKFL